MSQVMGWRSPVWADTASVIDESIVFSHRVGAVETGWDHEVIAVDLVRRELVLPDPEPGGSEAVSDSIRVAGVRLSPDEAQRLAEYLTEAVALLAAH